MSNGKFRNLEKNIHELKLRQMGATVKVIQGIMHYVHFDIDGTAVDYVYHINDDGNYYLQRLSPYPLTAGTYQSQEDIVDLIKHDIAQMKNAKKSKNFERFIEINQKLNVFMRNFEDLYLYYNVPGVQIKELEEKMVELKDLIIKTKAISKRVYFEKDPESI